MTFHPESVGIFLENFDEHKISIRSYPGCQHLELWKDQSAENIFMTYSIWESEEVLNKYRDSELFKTVWRFTKALFSEKPQVFSTKKIEEVIK
jgi:quinol monooxygenase YgiN